MITLKKKIWWHENIPQKWPFSLACQSSMKKKEISKRTKYRNKMKSRAFQVLHTSDPTIIERKIYTKSKSLLI